MSTTDDLTRLADLHRSGALTDEEYVQAKARVLNERVLRDQPPLVGALNGLRRSRSDRWIGGVCGGLAQASGMAPWLWRLAFALITFFGGVGLLVYLLFWIFVPAEPLPGQVPRQLGA
jgi:phage shock protein PspC (stress-responsive transcriptional regulator)